MTDFDDGRTTAAIALLGRMGAVSFQLRYSDDPKPVIWIADAEWRNSHECAAGMSVLAAVRRLLDVVVNGGVCAHCRRRTRVEHDTNHHDDEWCWYSFDPAEETYRRSCKGRITAKVGRNDQCPCGSGRKLKHCCA